MTLSEILERDHLRIDAGIAGDPQRPAHDEEDQAELKVAIEALRRHIFAEEELLFPRLHEAGMAGPIMVMLREHAQMWEMLDALGEQLASGDSAEVIRKARRQLIVLLQHHNPKEERILYPAADTTVDEATAADIRAFLDEGALPDGWVCRSLQRETSRT